MQPFPFSVKLYVKALELTAQQVNAIQNGRGEAMKMTKHMPPVGGVTAHLLKVFVRSSAGRACSHYIIGCDRI
jgi:hypothetical protein